MKVAIFGLGYVGCTGAACIASQGHTVIGIDPSMDKVEAIRAIDVMLGDGDKIPRGDEIKNREIARKSLVAAQDISEGERFSQENMTTKRPGTGRSPMSYWSYLGNATTKSYSSDELID